MSRQIAGQAWGGYRQRPVYPTLAVLGVTTVAILVAMTMLFVASVIGFVGRSEPVTALYQPMAAPAAPGTVVPGTAVPGRQTSPVRFAAPARIRIPSIGVDAALIRLGLKSDGSLQVPPNASLAGWFTGAPDPGELGPAIIAGHVHWNGQWGVFARLARLRVEDRIVVTRTDRSRAVFRVTRVSRFKKSQFPTNLVYGNIDHVGLRLITCDGFDATGHAYLDNLVVFAMLVSERPPIATSSRQIRHDVTAVADTPQSR